MLIISIRSRFRLMGKFWVLVGQKNHNKLGADDKTIRVWDVKSGEEIQ